MKACTFNHEHLGQGAFCSGSGRGRISAAGILLLQIRHLLLQPRILTLQLRRSAATCGCKGSDADMRWDLDRTTPVPDAEGSGALACLPAPMSGARSRNHTFIITCVQRWLVMFRVVGLNQRLQPFFQLADILVFVRGAHTNIQPVAHDTGRRVYRRCHIAK